MTSPFDHRISRDWSTPSLKRVQEARTDYRRWHEAGRATLEAVVRYLVRRGWQRRHTSKAKHDHRADSRYLRAPDRPTYEIRLSNHMHPTGQYHSREYIITYDVMIKYTVLELVQWIENDLHKNTLRRLKKQRKKQRAALPAQTVQTPCGEALIEVY